MNEKDKDGHYILLEASKNHNSEMIKLLIDYANNNNIILEMNEKDKNGNCPLLEASKYHSSEMIKLLKWKLSTFRSF
ncbi:hypothetical protein U3516DRAFT_887388 [Neocallimastix sp. 'constans']